MLQDRSGLAVTCRHIERNWRSSLQSICILDLMHEAFRCILAKLALQLAAVCKSGFESSVPKTQERFSCRDFS